MSATTRAARRDFLKAAATTLVAIAAAGRIPAARAADWNKAAFETKTLADAVKAMGGTQATESKEIVMQSPDIAENGAVVPFTISSKLPRTESIAILVEKNPNIVAANFTIPEGTEPWVNTRVKMGQTSNVIALVKADGKYYYTAKEVKVTMGGCGG